MPDEIFGPVHSFRDSEVALENHVKLWLDTFLARRERDRDIEPGTLARPRSYIPKQTFTALPGEDVTPAIIIVSDGFAESPNRHGDGKWDVKLRMAIVALCHGPEARLARDLAGHYQYALTNLVLKKRAFGPCSLDEWLDLRLEDVDEDQQRTLCAVRIELVYVVRDFVDDAISPPAAPDDPSVPPDDPYPPQPDPPIVETHSETTEVMQ
jgi:hypothetical protein